MALSPRMQNFYCFSYTPCKMYSREHAVLPSHQIWARSQKFYARFPSRSDLMRALRRSGDLFIENAGAADGPSRVKILGVVSADCH